MKSLLPSTVFFLTVTGMSLVAADEPATLSDQFKIKQFAAMNLTFGGSQSYAYVTDSTLLEKIALKKSLTTADLGNVATAGSANVWVKLDLPVSYYESFVVNRPAGIAVGNVSAGRAASTTVQLNAPIFAQGATTIGNVTGGANATSGATEVSLNAPLFSAPGARIDVGNVSGGRKLQTVTTSVKLPTIR